MVLIREIEPYERWSWHLLKPSTDVEVRLRASADDRTFVSVMVSRGNPRGRGQAAVRPCADRRRALTGESLPSTSVGSEDRLLEWNPVSVFTGGACK